MDKWKLKDAKLYYTKNSTVVYRLKFKNMNCALKFDTNEKNEINNKVMAVFKGEIFPKIIYFNHEALLMEFIKGESFFRQKSVGNISELDFFCLAICQALESFYRSAQKNNALYEFSKLNGAHLGLRFESLMMRGCDKVQDCSFDQVSLFQRAIVVSRKLIENQSNQILLHGDVHPGNILKSLETDWKLIDPDFVIGEKAYDLANVFYNPFYDGETIDDDERILLIAKYFSFYFNIELKKILEYAFVYGALSVSWQLEDSEDPSLRQKIALKIESLLLQF